MNIEQYDLFTGAVLSDYAEQVIEVGRFSTVGVQVVYAPIGSGNGIINFAISIDGIHYTPWPGYSLTVDSADTSIWEFVCSFYKFVKFIYTPISGEIIASLSILCQDKSVIKS